MNGMTEIHWQEHQDKLIYLGRNGSGKMAGLSILAISERVEISPINSKGNRARCFIEIPKDRIPEIINALQETLTDHQG